MGSAVGLALGLALAGLDTEVQAIRVTDEQVSNERAAMHLIEKTAALMRHYDAEIPADLARRTRLNCRHEFFGGGYGRSNVETEAAIEVADKQLDLRLESTYTGKTMAALCHDLRAGNAGSALFWNTYNSRPLSVNEHLAPDLAVMPQEFLRYFD
jgi:D-cysteine desulfhydrase